MARKKIMKLPFLSSCVSPRTLSFRAENAIFKTINSAYAGVVDAPSDPASFVSEPEYSAAAAANAGESVEAVIRGLRNADRLFFEPGETSSILDEAKGDCFPFKESVATEVDSNDPCRDFKISMEEMVAAHGLKDLESLEELLSCYLKVNGKSNHGYIVGAFVDLLVGFASASSSSCSDNDQSCSSFTAAHSPKSPLISFSSSTSNSTSPCLSSLEADVEIEQTVDSGSSSSAV